MTEILRPPAELRYLVEILGAEGTLALIERRGGTRLRIPKTFRAQSAFAAEFGAKAARELVRRRGGDDLKVPLSKAWRARVYDAQDMSYPAIARKLGCSETSVWRYLSRRAVPGQYTLGLEPPAPAHACGRPTDAALL